MLDMSQLSHDIHALGNGDDVSQRKAIHSLKDHEEKDWADASVETIDSLVGTLQQFLGETTRPALRQETITILGKIGPRSNPAVNQLVELLKEELPDAIREAAARALGKIGKHARV